MFPSSNGRNTLSQAVLTEFTLVASGNTYGTRLAISTTGQLAPGEVPAAVVTSSKSAWYLTQAALFTLVNRLDQNRSRIKFGRIKHATGPLSKHSLHATNLVLLMWRAGELLQRLIQVLFERRHFIVRETTKTQDSILAIHRAIVDTSWCVS